MTNVSKIPVEFGAVQYIAVQGKLIPMAAARDVTELWNTRISPFENASHQVRAHVSTYGATYIYDVLTDMRGQNQYTCWCSAHAATLEVAFDELEFLAQDDWKMLREAPAKVNGGKTLSVEQLAAMNAWRQQRAQERRDATPKQYNPKVPTDASTLEVGLALAAPLRDGKETLNQRLDFARWYQEHGVAILDALAEKEAQLLSYAQ